MKSTLIIAEAGVNANGSVEIAKQLIDVAKESGADIVKFQTAIPELLTTQESDTAEYQKTNTKDATCSQLEMLKNVMLPLDSFQTLQDYAHQKGVRFLSTGFDMVSLDLLNDLGIDIFKIPSGEITNLPYLKKIASFNKPIILSTGMSNMEEIKAALSVLTTHGISKDNITVLHCTTDYPAKMEDINLRAMQTIAKELDVSIGYSDHTLGIEVPIAAVALGATIIEKHFTLDRKMEGPDHAASLEPNELKSMVTAIRNIERALGGTDKIATASEVKNIAVARRSIHVSQDMNAGEIITENHIIMKRPGDGISPMEMDHFIGSKLNKDLRKDHKISLDDIIKL